MNKTQSKAVAEAAALMQSAHDLIDPIAAELREKFDNMGERAQDGEKGQQVDEEATKLEEVRDNLASDINDLENLG